MNLNIFIFYYFHIQNYSFIININFIKMENMRKIPIFEIKKKLNTKKAIIDFFREQGKQIVYLFIY